MPNNVSDPLIFKTEDAINPLLNATWSNNQYVDQLTGKPLTNPLMNKPKQQTAQPSQPQIDVGAWEKATGVYSKSSVQQRKLFTEYADDLHKQWMQANPNSTVSKEELTRNLLNNLSKDKNNLITRDPESGFWRDVAGTAVNSVTGLVDAAAGLTNAAVSAVTGPNAVTAGLAKYANEAHEATKKINSEARQDYDKQFEETRANGNLSDLVGLVGDNLGYGFLDLAEMVGSGIGAGAGVKVAARAGEKALAKTVLKGTEEGAAKLANPLMNSARLNQASNIVGQGVLGGGLGAQAIGKNNGDFQLSRQQAVGAGVDGFIAALATGIGQRYGFTPESILLGATPVRLAKAEVPSIIKATLQSMGVEAASNGVQGISDAILTTAYDKEGNFDIRKVDWDNVKNAGLETALVGGLLGSAGGLVGGTRAKRAATKLNNAVDTINAEIDANANGPTTNAPGGRPQTAEQRARTDSAIPDPTQGAQYGFMNNPAFQNFFRDYGDGTGTGTTLGEPIITPGGGGGVRDNPLRNRASRAEEPATNVSDRYTRADSNAQPADYMSAFRSMYDKAPPEQRESQMASMRQRVNDRLNSDDIQEAVAREAARQAEGYVESNPEQAAIDKRLIAGADSLKQAADQLEQYHQLKVNSALAYGADAPTGPVAQQVIDDRIANAAAWNGEAVRPEVTAQARGMMAEFQQTPDNQKDAFVTAANESNAAWFTQPFDPRDGRTFDQLAYDAKNEMNPLKRGRAQRLFAAAEPEAARRVQLRQLLNEEYQAWQKANEKRLENLQRDVNKVPDQDVRDMAAKTVLQAQDGPAIRAARDLGKKALQAIRSVTPVASELARRGVPDTMRRQLDRDVLGLQRGSEEFGRTVAELTGAPGDDIMAAVKMMRDLDPQAYGKDVVFRVLSAYEALPGASGQTRLNTTRFLNFFQGKQDLITESIGEWRSISMEDIRRMNAGVIPELAEVGNFTLPEDLDKNTRAYVTRMVEEKINAGGLEGDAPVRLRLMRDWLMADTSEASFLTADEARAARADNPSVRERRVLNDGDILAAGKGEGDDAMLTRIPEIRAALAEGDLSAALARAIEHMPAHRAVILRALKTMIDRLPDPVRVRISEEPLVVRGREVQGYFDRATGELVIDTRYADIPYVMAHESVHAASHSYIDMGLNGKLSGQRLSAFHALTQLFEEAKRRSEMPEYGRTNLHEFVAEAMSNPEMQDFLKSYESRTVRARLRNMYNTFVGAIRAMVGFPPKSYSALESVIGLTNVLIEGGPTGRAKAAESKGLQAGILSRFNADGSRENFGTMQRHEDGSYKVVVNGNDVFEKDTRFFNSFTDADKYVTEHYGGEIRELTDRAQAIQEGLLSRYDVLNPVISKVAQAVQDVLGRFLPENAQRYANRVVQTIATGAQWVIIQTDRFEILNSLDRAMKAAGFETNFYQRAEDSRRLQRAQGRIGSDLATMLTNIGEILRPAGLTADDLGQYMYAMHGLERNQKNNWKGDTTGFRWTDSTGKELSGNEAMNAYLNSLPEKNKQVLRAGAQHVWDQWQRVLKEEERSGILSTEQYRKLGGLDEKGQREEGAYEFYVPLRNADDLNSWLMPSQGVTGRSTEAVSPFVALSQQLQQRMSAVYRNDALRDIGEMLEENPIPEVGVPDTYKLRYDIDGSLKALPEHVRNSKNAVYWREGGNLKVVHINTETREGKHLLKALRSDNMNQNTLLRGLTSLTRYMAQFNTILNPAFQLKTISWDVASTLLNFQSAYGGDLSAMDGAKLGMRSVLRAGRLLPGIAKDRFQGSSQSPAYNLFGRLGGGMGAGAFLNAENIDRAVAFKSTTTNANILAANGLLKGSLKIAKGQSESLLHMLHSADDAMRYAGFIEFLEHHTGQDITTLSAEALDTFVRQNEPLVTQGIRGSKEINGNFERQGSSASLLQSVYAFWNAALQGSRLFASIASSKQGQYGMMAMLAMGVASALNGLNDPDDDNGAGGSKYADIRNRKDSLIIGDAAIPILYEGRLPYIIGNSMTLFMSGKISAWDLIKDVFSSSMDMISPVTPLESGDMGYDIVYAATPTGVQLIFPLFLGKTAFNTSTDNQYVVGPDGKRVYNPLPVETAKPDTSYAARKLAEWMDTAGLGNIAYPGRIDEAFKSVTGGAFTAINSMFNPSMETLTKGRNPYVAAVGSSFFAHSNDYAVTKKYTELQAEFSANYRRAVTAGTGESRNLLASPKAVPFDHAARIDKQVRDRMKYIRRDGKDESEWRAVQNAAREVGDRAQAEAAKLALYEIQQRKSQVYGWGIQELKKLEKR